MALVARSAAIAAADASAAFATVAADEAESVVASAEVGAALVGVLVVAFEIAVSEWCAQNPPTKVCVQCTFATMSCVASRYTKHSRGTCL